MIKDRSPKFRYGKNVEICHGGVTQKGRIVGFSYDTFRDGFVYYVLTESAIQVVPEYMLKEHVDYPRVPKKYDSFPIGFVQPDNTEGLKKEIEHLKKVNEQIKDIYLEIVRNIDKAHEHLRGIATNQISDYGVGYYAGAKEILDIIGGKDNERRKEPVTND